RWRAVVRACGSSWPRAARTGSSASPRKCGSPAGGARAAPPATPGGPPVGGWAAGRRAPGGAGGSGCAKPAPGRSPRAPRAPAPEFEAMMRVNYLSVVYGVLAALPHMRRQRDGHIVNVASVVGKRAVPFVAAYAASKFAVVGFSEALRMELRRDGIRVTSVC